MTKLEKGYVYREYDSPELSRRGKEEGDEGGQAGDVGHDGGVTGHHDGATGVEADVRRHHHATRAVMGLVIQRH